MRVVLIHSGGAAIAGDWPPAWVAYLAGSLKTAGFTDVHFLGATADNYRRISVGSVLSN